jgi:hypothetical protein
MKIILFLYFYLIPEIISIIITLIWSILKQEYVIIIYSSVLIAFLIIILLFNSCKNNCSCDSICDKFKFGNSDGSGNIYGLIIILAVILLVGIFYLFYILLKELKSQGRIITFHLLFLFYILLVSAQIFNKYFDDENYLIFSILICNVINFILLIIITILYNIE